MENKDVLLQTTENGNDEQLAITRPVDYIEQYRNSHKDLVMTGDDIKRNYTYDPATWTPSRPKESRGRAIAMGINDVVVDAIQRPEKIGQWARGGLVGLKKTFFPNMDEKDFERTYRNVQQRMNMATEARQQEIAQAGYPETYEWTNAIATLVEYVLAGYAGASLGAAGATSAAAARSISKGLGVTARQAKNIAKGAKKGAEIAVGTLAGVQTTGQLSQEFARKYAEDTGDVTLANYNPTRDTAISGMLGVISAFVNTKLDVARYAGKFGTKGALQQGLRAAREEFVEEATESITQDLGRLATGYDYDITLDSIAKNAITNGLMGAVLGGAAGTGLYMINKARLERWYVDKGLPEATAKKVADDLLTDGRSQILDQINTNYELAVKNGEAYTKVKDIYQKLYENIGAEKAPELADTYARMTSDWLTMHADQYGMATSLFIDANEAMDNMITLRQFTPEDVRTRISELKSELTHQKAIGEASNPQMVSDIKRKLRVLQKVDNINTAKENARIQEIDNKIANTEGLAKTIDSAWDNRAKKGSTAAQLAYLSNNKNSFKSTMVNAPAKVKNGLANIANIVNEDTRTTIGNALEKLDRVNADNFIDTVSNSLSNTDSTLENTMLYLMLFEDQSTLTQFVINYTETLKSNQELSSKDAIGQTLREIDGFKQITNPNYISKFGANGEMLDPNMLAAFISYQNQFSTLNQTAYASMRKDLIGDFIDANKFAYSGEGGMAHAWGNYFLANKDLDKRYYFDRFNIEEGTPEIKYADVAIKDLFYNADLNIVEQTLRDWRIENKKEAILDRFEREQKAIQKNIEDYKDTVEYYIEKALAKNGIVDDKLARKLINSYSWMIKPKYHEELGFKPVKLTVEEAELRKKYTIDDYEVDRRLNVIAELGKDYDHAVEAYNTVKDWDLSKLTGVYNITYKNKPLTDLGFKTRAVYILDRYLKNNTNQESLEKTIADVEEEIKDSKNKDLISDWEHDLAILKDMKPEDFNVIRGASMYRTDFIPENDVLLNENKKFSKQPKGVQESIRNLLKEIHQEKILVNKEFPQEKTPFGKLDWDSQKSIISDVLAKENQRLTSGDWGYGEIAKNAQQIEATYLSFVANGELDLSLLKENHQKTLKESKEKLSSPIVSEGDIQKYARDAIIANDLESIDEQFIEKNTITTKPDKTGIDIYNDIAKYFQSKKEASLALLKHGVKGTTYWGKRDGRGFVIFEPVPVSEKLLQGKAANGWYDPELATIALGRNFNELTLAHELAHHWLTQYFNLYRQYKDGTLKTSKEWVEDAEKLFSLIGIDPNQRSVTREQQEKWATMNEAYLTGFVPEELKNNISYKDFQQWIPEKYKSILQIGYLDKDGNVINPILSEADVEFFNKWYAHPDFSALHVQPEAQKWAEQAVSTKVMNDREKTIAQDWEEQESGIQTMDRVRNDNIPTDLKSSVDAAEVLQNANDSQEFPTLPAHKSFALFGAKNAQERMADIARNYVSKNPEHAKEIAMANPLFVENDTGVDREFLILAVIENENYKMGSPEYAQLMHNAARTRQIAGSTLGLHNTNSFKWYLDAITQIEETLENKVAMNYAGRRRNARSIYNADIERFVLNKVDSILATAKESKERDVALSAMFAEAKTKFSGNVSGTELTQLDLTGKRATRANKQAFIEWAKREIKRRAGVDITSEMQVELMKVSQEAQKAELELDNTDKAKAIAAAKTIREWQNKVNSYKKTSKGKVGRFFDSVFGEYAPRAMLFSPSTLLANVPGNVINGIMVSAVDKVYGKNSVSKEAIKAEIDRLKAISRATGMNFATMEKPTSPSILHGEKYKQTTGAIKAIDPFTYLSETDNLFRIPIFVDTLARIATRDATAQGISPTELFRQYCKINTVKGSVAQQARLEAIEIGNIAVFTQNGMLAKMATKIRDALNIVGTGTYGLGNLVSPFVKTPANIVEMGARAIAFPVTGWKTLLNWSSASEKAKFDFALDGTTLAVAALATILMSALQDDKEWYKESYESGKYDPNKPYDSIRFGNAWIRLDQFGTLMLPMQVGAKLVKELQAGKAGSEIAESVSWQAFSELLRQTPVIDTFQENSMKWAATHPGQYALNYAYNQANKLVPALAKQITRPVMREYGIVLNPESKIGKRAVRNYGLDGQDNTINDWIGIIYGRLKVEQ